MSLVQEKKHHIQWIKVIYREFAQALAPSLKKLGVSANQITLSRLGFVAIACFYMQSDTLSSRLVVFLSLLFFSAFDALDGSLANISYKSQLGTWLDPQIDRIGFLAIFTALAVKFSSNQFDEKYWMILSMSIPSIFYFRGLLGSDIRLKSKFSDLKNELFGGPVNLVSHPTQSGLATRGRPRKLLGMIATQCYPHTHNVTLLVALSVLTGFVKLGVLLITLLIVIAYLIESARIIKRAADLDRKV